VTTTRTAKTVVDEAMAMIKTERPQLGPFASYLRNWGFHVPRSMRPPLSEEHRGELEEAHWREHYEETVEALRSEADGLEREIEAAAITLLLTGAKASGGRTSTEPVPYPEAAQLGHMLSYLDPEDIEPACKAFVERVNFHRMMREMGQ
jgi:hypothetical protein